MNAAPTEQLSRGADIPQAAFLCVAQAASTAGAWLDHFIASQQTIPQSWCTAHLPCHDPKQALSWAAAPQCDVAGTGN